MSQTATITVDQMRDKLMTVGEARQSFAKTEPLALREFPLEGRSSEVAKFDLGSWNEAGAKKVDALDGTKPVKAYVEIGDERYQLTKDALLEATSFIGITRQYATRTPPRFIQPELNYWFAHNGAAHGQKTFRALIQRGKVLGFGKATIVPFSNLRLFDAIQDGVAKRFGDSQEMLVDYKFAHSLRRTAARIILPGVDHEVRGDGDVWSLGLQLKNSAIGEQKTPLELTRYLFRWWCTNGSLHVSNEQRRIYNRRRDGQNDAEVMAWATDSIDALLNKFEPEFKKLDHFARARLPRGQDVSHVLMDVFETYRVPLDQRDDIISEMDKEHDDTLYGIMNAITRVANDRRLPDTIAETLMTVGGDLPTRHSNRCDHCHRLPV